MAEIDYVQAVKENVQAEFDKFYMYQMSQSKKAIFYNNYQIRFYEELKEFLIYNPESALENKQFRCLYAEGKNILANLYDYYLGEEYAYIYNLDATTDLIRDYNERYHGDLLEKEAEAE